MSPRRPTAASALCDAVAEAGVRHVFGLPGTQTVGLFEALRRSGLHTVVPAHETAAGFMAVGAALASGRAGVVTAIPGPGFAHLIPPLAEARLDSVPLLAIVGAPASTTDGRPGLQAIPQASIAAPLCKAVLEAEAASDLPRLAREGLELAADGEPGPVLLHVPTSLLDAPVERPQGREPSAAPAGAAEGATIPGLEELRDRLRASRRPLLLLGGGAAGAAEGVRALVRRRSALVVPTTSGRGIVPDDDPAAVVPDRWPNGWEGASLAAGEADLVLALGIRFSHNGTGGGRLRVPPPALVRVDRSSAVLEGPPEASLAIAADAGALVGRLLEGLGPSDGWPEERRAAVLSACAGQTGAEPVFPELGGAGARELFADLGTSLGPEGVLVTDSGLHQMLARRHFAARSPRSLLVPADFQSMGFGLPAAVGAALASGPDRAVAAVVGDGGLRISMAELATAATEGLSLTVLVLVDRALGLIRAQQLSAYGHEHGTSLRPLDLESLARGLGVRHERVRERPRDAIGRALRTGGVSLLEVLADDPPGSLRTTVAARAREAARRVLGPGRAREIRRRLGGSGSGEESGGPAPEE